MKKIKTLLTLFLSPLLISAQNSANKNFNFYPLNSKKPLEEKYIKLKDSILENGFDKNDDFTSDYAELITYIEGFRDEARRNGNVNWGKGYKNSLKWVKFILIERTDFFPSDIKTEILNDIKRISKAKYPYTGNDLYDRLIRRSLEYYEAGMGRLY